MPKYRITGPDGSVYEVSAPEGATEQDALAYVQKNAATLPKTVTQPTQPTQSAQPAPQRASAAPQQAQTLPGPAAWQTGTQRTPFSAPNITGNQTVDTALEPITGYRGRLNEAYTGSQQMAQHGLQTLRGGDPTGLLGLVPGAAGMAAAPVSAALEPIARPINEYVSPLLEKAFGTPPEVSTPVLTSLVPGLGITKFPMPKAPPSLPRPNVKLSATPTNQEMRSQAGRWYKAADDAGVMFKPEGVERLRQGILAELEDGGFATTLHPRVAAVLKRIDDLSGSDQNLSLRGAEIIRRVAQNAAKSTDKSERMLGWRVVDQITDFLANPTPDDVLIGDARVGGQALANARDLWARMSKSEAIDLAIETAQSRAKTTGSGANIDNTIRQNVNKILGKEQKPRGFSPDEVKALKAIAEGTTVRNALRFVGKAAPTGVVSGGFGVATTALAPGGWMVPVVGFMSKIMADNMTRGAAENLSARIRRGRLPQQKPQRGPVNAPRSPLPPFTTYNNDQGQ